MGGSEMITAIPFSGFYESVWSREIDEAAEREAEWLQKDKYPTLTVAEIIEAFYWRANYPAACLAVAKEYVDSFEAWVNNEYELHISLTLESMTSPREYNFTTGRIFCEISTPDVLELYQHVDDRPIREKAREMFTSYDGFFSSYSRDTDDWGPIESWDHNQLLAIFEAAVEGTDYEYSILCGMDGVLDTAFNKCVDWPALEDDLNALVAELAGEEYEKCPFEFPKAYRDAQDYVAQFSTLNHLKI
jgi:hypothetical protein